MDATADLAAILETVEATRADVAELRHELDVLKARVAETATKADIQTIRAEMQGLRGEFQHALLVQTRWMLAGLVTILLAILFRS